MIFALRCYQPTSLISFTHNIIPVLRGPSLRTILTVFPAMCDKQPVRRSARNISKTKKSSAKAPKSKSSSPSKSPSSSSSREAFMAAAPADGSGCNWAQITPDYKSYHNEEWGVAVYDDKKMFEYLLLETFQAGLNWLLILRKREFFRQAFHNFDVDAVSKMTDEDVEHLKNNPGIIRHEGKIRAAIGNAKAVVKMRDEENLGLADYFWKWVDYEQVINKRGKDGEYIMVTKNKLSDDIAKDLKKRSFKFVGSTTIYSHLQAVGIINDHHPLCPRFEQCKGLVRPKPEVSD